MPTHEEITERARQIWESRGKPSHLDLDIWLEAERELGALPASPAPSDAGFAARTKAETASESAAEYHISPPVSEEEAIRAAIRRNESPAEKKDRTARPPPAQPKKKR